MDARAHEDLRRLTEWASHAHAELFVAARHIDAQRERVNREANELARVEAHWTSAPGQVSESR